ncbi:MAG: ABC transporter ATP-binding protein [Acidobacteria bacterium]|nr:ABC transporter ATP-binding protein [Acidobacteriota bacterium]MBI3489397.1 ABC transporter ATP-binding protein [Acidobacteriota bacterium]
MTQPALRVQGLCKRFLQVQAIDALDLEVAEGEVFGILGPNGAGKSTCLEMIEGLIPPDAGTIEVLGLKWQHQGPLIRARMGVQLQRNALYNKITPREALTLYGSYYPQCLSTPALLERVQLTDKADDYHGTLSAGQRQRLALAMALVNDPELVFLDEPTTGLDPQARHSFWEVVRGLKREGRTVILTTHYMEEAEALCDRVAILDRGRLLAQGRPSELIQELEHPSVVELTFDSPEPDPTAFAAQLRQPIKACSHRWEIPTRDPKHLLPPLLDLTKETGLSFRQIHVRQPTLEDVFLQRTGRHLRD